MNPTLRAVACATPDRRLERAQWIEIAQRIAPASVPIGLTTRLAERSGIEGRWCAGADAPDEPDFYPHDPQDGGPGTAMRMQLWERTARPLSVQATRDALAEAGVQASEITHVVTASCTGFAAPGIDLWLMQDAGLPPDCRRTHVGFMGCHAAVNALAVAAAFVRADPRACVLVCCAEICSAHLHYGARLDRLIANTLFADGAAAAVVSADGPAHAPRIQCADSVLIPDSANAMGWHIGDHGFEMTLAATVPELLRQHVGPWTRACLERQSLEPAGVGAWAIHPGGPRVIESVLASIGLSEDRGHASLEVLRRFGNMSSATLLFILRDLWKANAPRPWMALAFGPGLVGESLLLR